MDSRRPRQTFLGIYRSYIASLQNTATVIHQEVVYILVLVSYIPPYIGISSERITYVTSALTSENSDYQVKRESVDELKIYPL